MANVKFSRHEIEKEIKLTPQNIEKIMMMGIPVEKVSDNELEIEILANRPDLISMHGFLRAVRAYLEKEPGLKKYKINKGGEDYTVKIDSSVANVRPYTSCAIVKGLNFDDEKIKEIIEIQEKLHLTFGRNRKKIAIGIYPLEKIKLPITYKAVKPESIKFMPLEAKREMNGLDILQNHPTGKEYAHLLEGFDRFPIFTDAKGKILSMPPIINSDDVGKITQNTNEVFIECSGSDLNAVNKTLNIIVTTLADIGGKIYSMNLIYDKKIGILTTPDLSPEKIKVSVENVNKNLGINIKEKDMEKLLGKMGYDYSSGKALAPAWRTDILHEIDIIEDIAIAYGYDNLDPEIPKVATIGMELDSSKINSKISEILIGLGLIEVSSYYLVKTEEIGFDKTLDKIELENSKTEYKYLRPNLSISACRILAENKDNEYPQRIFEIGPVFRKDDSSETQIREQNNLMIVLTPGNFTDSKRILDYLSSMLKINLEIESKEIKTLIDGRSAIIFSNGKEIGHIGEMHPEHIRNFGIKMPVSIIEINLSNIFS